ncbi:RHS repeat domain-containing protein [Streptomyces anulatus]|uniref:RHS repeat domain-containing protein n=1 Tax=Streptomyces anulatus TaxID=1892 RepID=UPI0004C7C03D
MLYAGATELHLKSDGTFWAQRFYGSTELSVAVRTNQSGANKLFYLAGDQHGTSSLAIASDTQAVTKRYLTAFGVERAGAVGSWVDDRSFLGKTRDRSTGLTHLDAREYDAELGRFISVDSLLETEKHQSLAGYGYAENNPVTLSDPTGLGSFSCTMGVDCPTGVEKVEETVSPPLWGASSTGTSGTSWSGPLGYTGIPTLPLVQQPPLLMGPDPMPLLFTGPVSPEMQKLQKMFMEAQAMCRLPSGSLVNNEHGGDGKVNSDGPWSLAFRWAWGADFHWKSSKQAITLPDAKYDGDDTITQNLIESTSMKDARVFVANTFRDTGALKGKTKYSTTKNAEGQNRNLAQLVGLYASDVGGLLVGKKDRKAQGVLGSYDLQYTITESKGSTLTVKYTATTDINNESFIPMHAKWQEAANNGPKHMGGFFAGYRVEIRWQETIYK